MPLSPQIVPSLHMQTLAADYAALIPPRTALPRVGTVRREDEESLERTSTNCVWQCQCMSHIFKSTFLFHPPVEHSVQ